MSYFPENASYSEGADNPAIQLYGRRFYKDQTPVEYLAEFLLAFASPKGDEPPSIDDELKVKHAFSFSIGDEDEPPQYWPEDRISLKLFAFFPTSKLDTRHEIHQQHYIKSLDDLRARIEAGSNEKEEAIRLLQSLFSGFVGVAKTRTWVTQSFIPAAHVLLAREVTWNHPDAIKNKKKLNTKDWVQMCEYFDSSTHNFMGRGGELLFLQLVQLFAKFPNDYLSVLLPEKPFNYLHNVSVSDLRCGLESAFHELLTGSIAPVSELAKFCESIWSELYIYRKKRSPTKLGWVPSSTNPEAALFAVEAQNICQSDLSPLEKIKYLQTLCLMQVLRSLCIQAVRAHFGSASDSERTLAKINGTLGNYSWICADSSLSSTHAIAKLAQSSFGEIEGILYRALRLPGIAPDINLVGKKVHDQNLKNGDDNCFRLFRKFGKELGLVIPPTGKGQRFVLPPKLLHFLVIALVEPGGRIPLDTFYARVFAHYGIALGPRQLAAALAPHERTGSGGHHDYAIAADTGWIEEALRQGDFLVELSDAVSIVRNPSSRNEA